MPTVVTLAFTICLRDPHLPQSNMKMLRRWSVLSSWAHHRQLIRRRGCATQLGAAASPAARECAEEESPRRSSRLRQVALLVAYHGDKYYGMELLRCGTREAPNTCPVGNRVTVWLGDGHPSAGESASQVQFCSVFGRCGYVWGVIYNHTRTVQFIRSSVSI